MKTWTTEVETLDDSKAVTIPEELLEDFGLSLGDPVRLYSVEDGILITPRDSRFSRAMDAYGRSASKYRNALRKLAE